MLAKCFPDLLLPFLIFCCSPDYIFLKSQNTSDILATKIYARIIFEFQKIYFISLKTLFNLTKRKKNFFDHIIYTYELNFSNTSFPIVWLIYFLL